jgi:ribosomal protein S24E
MEISIKSKTENPLMNRTEIQAVVSYAASPTPKRGEVRKLLAAQLGADENLLVIRKLKPKFGSHADCLAILYKSKEDLDKTEPEHIRGREAGQKKKPGKKEEEKK